MTLLDFFSRCKLIHNFKRRKKTTTDFVKFKALGIQKEICLVDSQNSNKRNNYHNRNITNIETTTTSVESGTAVILINIVNNNSDSCSN